MTPDGEITYWAGGEYFSVYPEDAVRFMKEYDAEETILVLIKAWPSNKTPYVAPTGAGDSGSLKCRMDRSARRRRR